MKIRNLEKIEKIEYPTISTMHNNSFMEKVPLFAAALSSMLLTNNVYATETLISPIEITPIIAGGIPVHSPSPLEIAITYISLITAILSLIIIYINTFKAVKLSKTSTIDRETENYESDKNNESETNLEKLKKLKKKTYIAFAIFVISVIISAFINNFY